MKRAAPLLPLNLSHLVAWLMVLAVAALWQPRVMLRSQGAVLTAQAISGDKGQAPRGAVLVQKALDDRLPFGPLADLGSRMGVPQARSAPLRRLDAPMAHLCTRTGPCPRPEARAPPQA